MFCFRFFLVNLVLVVLLGGFPLVIFGQEPTEAEEEELRAISNDLTGTKEPVYTIFEDSMLLAGYTNKFKDTSEEILLEMIKDDNLSPFKSAAAIRVFREKYSQEIFGREKIIAIKHLLRRLNKTNSSFVQVEAMHTICVMDRFRYFSSMVPALLQKMNHYNNTVDEMAYGAINELITVDPNKTREARIVFNTLRKMLFLSRKKLEDITDPGPKLARKLKLLRWSIKVLGSQEIQKLPKEVLNLL